MVFGASIASGQNALSEKIQPSRLISATRITEPHRIDGLLDDDCWRKAEPVTNFTQVLPVQGAVPSERTEVRFVYTTGSYFLRWRQTGEKFVTINARDL